MNQIDPTDLRTLALTVSKWRYLWPAVWVPTYLLNPSLNLWRTESDSPVHVLLWMLLLVLSIAGGLGLSAGVAASQCWRELRAEPNRILLRPLLQLPRWARRSG